MLQLSQCRLPYQAASLPELKQKVGKILHVKVEEMTDFHIVRKSIDARKKPEIFVSYTVRFSSLREKEICQRNRGNRNLSNIKKEESLVSQIHPVCSREKIVVVGAGPAGLFCAYYLSLCGLHPVLIERGAPMEERTGDVERFWKEGMLCPDSNVSFGEGGAGTFSDGKLNTGVKDRTGRKQFVLESFVRFGAGEDILYDAKPHIGTDVLRDVIVAMRRELQAKGCEIRFYTKLTEIQTEEGQVSGVQLMTDKGSETISCDRLILAIGHSARDTFRMLKGQGIAMSPKAFAMGVRVQHKQGDIDRAQYGIEDERLPASPYKLTGKTKDQRGVYSFCMCPGGYVVNASSEPGGLVVNGMSDAGRDSGYANSAIVVTVEPEDFPNEDCLAGVAFQQTYEKLAYDLCQGKIPVQCLGDFCRNQRTKETGRIKPCVRGNWEFANLRKALPKFVIDGMIDGMGQFSEKIQGFAQEDTLLLGLESRTSSPVRIERNKDFESLTLQRLYPCGEGAGYAGGIMSAAMDGLRVAMQIQKKLEQQEE